MNIIAVDDERLALESIKKEIKGVLPNVHLETFQNAEDALSYVKEKPCRIAFLDIHLPKMDGIKLAKQLKLVQPDINIIFTTAYTDYHSEAFDLHASGYLMKPITGEKILKEISDLRYPVHVEKNPKRLSVKTFGNFEAYLDGEPIHFQYNKTRELLAYLVDRNGSLCTNHELISVLWEDVADQQNKSSYFQNLKSDLISTLKKAGCDDIVVRQYGKLGLRPDRFSCDLYDFLKGEIYALNAYNGEYMTQYSWGEFTLGWLLNEYDK